MIVGQNLARALLSPLSISAIFSTLMVGLAVAGGFLGFSSVPFWDMWNGALLFTMKFQDGQLGQIWSQHNEHRIVLARLLFILDSSIFGDRSVFLICMNYVIMAFAGFYLVHYISQISMTIADSKPTARVLSLMIFGWVFLWTQQENFVWAFQSQFFLMTVLPLIAFYFLARSADHGDSVSFGISLFLGVLSAGTMANGIAVLPLMLLCAFFLKLPLCKISLLFILSVAVPFAYFYGYVAPEHHGSLLSSLRDDPGTVLLYTMIYLGSPFFHIFGHGTFAYFVAFCFGLGISAGSIFLASKILFSTTRSPFQVSLLHYVAFVGATALATAGGRAVFGIHAVVAERYTTPTVVMWAAFVVLVWATFPKAFQLSEQRNSIRAWSGILTIFSFFVLMLQFNALQSKALHLADQNLAALALELGVHDSDAIEKVYPVADHVILMAEEIVKRRRSVFGRFPFRDLRAKLGQPPISTGSQLCVGSLDEIIPVPTDPSFVKVRGWIFDQNSNSVSELVSFINFENVVSGFAITGWPRDDVVSAISPSARYSGFFGYLRRQDVEGGLSAIGSSPDCVLELSMPKIVE